MKMVVISKALSSWSLLSPLPEAVKVNWGVDHSRKSFFHLATAATFSLRHGYILQGSPVIGISWVVFGCLPSLRSGLCSPLLLRVLPRFSAQFTSIRPNGFYWHYIWHMSPEQTLPPKLISLPINQDVNLRSAPPLLLALHLCFPAFSLISSSYFFLLALITDSSFLTPFPLRFPYHHSSPSLEHELLCASLTARALGGGRWRWSRLGRAPSKVTESARIFTLLSGRVASGWNSNWVMGPSLGGYQYYTRSLCVLMSLGQRTTSTQIDSGSDVRMFCESIAWPFLAPVVPATTRRRHHVSNAGMCAFWSCGWILLFVFNKDGWLASICELQCR